jgi:outer membrane protein OmpA-like peptidoglycan-associated protein
MYNVFFFKDAAVMKANSQFELNSLIDMLKENDELRIKIHGHTNGTARGKIITISDESENFFTLNQDIVEEFGSAKELSLQRAEVIKNYLITFGLEAGRMEVIGWGGKKPIYDKMDKLAVKNVRVEIEILEK